MDVLGPHDARVQSRTAAINGLQLHFLHGRPHNRASLATIFLIHGFPDLSYGWRYQIPMLLDMGFEVVAPDSIGYGGSDAPHVPPESIQLYGMKRASDDIAALAKLVGASQVILGGHDWGGYTVYRVALWYPELIKGIFAVCTPYAPPRKTFDDLDQVVSKAKQFGYQKHLAGPEVESALSNPQMIRNFLRGMYGGRPTSQGAVVFSPEHGLNLRTLASGVDSSPLVSEDVMDYYVEQYSKHGMHGPLNWYRTRKVNWEEELQLKSVEIQCPVLFIAAERDSVLLPSMARGMHKHIARLTTRSVPASHWALWQTPQQTNQYIKEWLEKVIVRGQSQL